MPSCVNLLDLAGDRFKVEFDPAYDPKGIPRHSLDPWMMLLTGRRGTIFPHGGTTLAVEVDRPGVARLVAAIPGVTLHQDGDDEKTFLFGVALFDQVAAIVRPRRRRRLRFSEPDLAARRLRAKALSSTR